MSTQTDKSGKTDTDKTAEKAVDAAKDAAEKAPAGKSLVTKGQSKAAKAEKAKSKGTGKRAANVLETPDQFDAWATELTGLLAKYRTQFEAGRAVDAAKTANELRKVADRGYRAGRRLYEPKTVAPTDVLRNAIKAAKEALKAAAAPAEDKSNGSSKAA